MIFVTIGTGKFEKIVNEADKLAGNIKEKVIIQKGKSKSKIKNAENFDFTTEFEDYVKRARIIISHGGAGTIFSLLEKGKKIIGVANLNRIDKHQEDILEELDKQGNLIYCRDFNLEEAVNKLKKTKLKKYEKPGFWIDKEIIKCVGY